MYSKCKIADRVFKFADYKQHASFKWLIMLVFNGIKLNAIVYLDMKKERFL